MILHLRVLMYLHRTLYRLWNGSIGIGRRQDPFTWNGNFRLETDGFFRTVTKSEGNLIYTIDEHQRLKCICVFWGG
jgi:hypothetical protein